MSLKIDEYSNYYETASQIAVQNAKSKAQTEDESEKERDSYISSIGNTEEISPCENYNDIFLKVFKTSNADATKSYSSEESQTAPDAAENTGSDSEDEDETKAEIVTVNGFTYLETTTVTNVVTSVQRTVLNGQENKQGKTE